MVRNVFESKLGCDPQAAAILTKVTTYNNCLPQGAPTSPFLANVAALNLDTEIIRICEQKVGAGLFSYSRYVDDITISGGFSLTSVLDEIFAKALESGFKINGSKTKISKRSNRQSVTGVVVNQKLSAPKVLIRKLRQNLYYCRKYGLHSHADWRGMHANSLVQQLRGQIGYLRMTQPGPADRFSSELDSFAPKHSVVSDDEIKLSILKEYIDREYVAKFLYDEVEITAAPSELVVDARGSLRVRAFQLSPKREWKTYLIRKMESLRHYRTNEV
jgi:retron-type reverse transcriptase